MYCTSLSMWSLCILCTMYIHTRKLTDLTIKRIEDAVRYGDIINRYTIHS